MRSCCLVMLATLAACGSTQVDSSRPTPRPGDHVASEPVAPVGPVDDPRDAVCRPDGWCQLAAFPMPQTATAIWADARDEVWVVGDGGTMARFDGREWRRIDSGTTAHLTALWGTDGEVFAVGQHGAVVRADAHSIHTDDPPTPHPLSAVWGNDAEDVFAVGSHGTIVHWDGTRWTTQRTDTDEVLTAVWGRSAREVWAGGRGGVLLKYDGSSWSRVTPPDGDGNIRSLHGTRDELLAGVGSRLWRRRWVDDDGEQGRWEQVGDDRVWLDEMAGDSLDGLMGISIGGLRRRGATEWERVADVGCRHVWASTNDEAYCAGNRVYRVTPDGAEELSSGARVELRAVWGVDDQHVIATGASGTALHFDGTRWSPTETGTESWLFDVWGSDWNHAWAVGSAGVILFWDGREWTDQPSNLRRVDYLSAVWGSGPRDVWAVGNDGAVAHFDGERWSPVDSGTTQTLVGVWGRSPSEVYAFGEGALVIRWDGERWTPAPIADDTMSLREVGEAEHVFARMNRAELAFDGERWRWVAPRLGARAYLRISDSSAFLFDYEHGIRRFDGSSWSTAAVPKPKANEFWAASPTSVYAVGHNGSILHWDGVELPRGDVLSLGAVDHEAAQRRHAFARHLREGRRLSGRRRYAEAQRAFERAVTLEPDNGTALCEHGWAAFRAGDLARAERSLRRGVRRARVPNTQGACLYNLGRLEERRRRGSIAVERYLESLRVRPNETVRRRLAALGAAPRAGSHDWAARCAPTERMSGPEELCDYFLDGLGEVGDDDQSCTDSAPFAFDGPGDLMWMHSNGSHVNASMLVHVQDDTFRPIGVLEVSESWNYDDVGADETTEIIGVRQVVAGGLPEIVFETSHSDFDTTALRYSGMCDESDDPDCEEPGDDDTYHDTTTGMAVCSFVRDRWICAEGSDGIPDDLPSLLRCRP